MITFNYKGYWILNDYINSTVFVQVQDRKTKPRQIISIKLAKEYINSLIKNNV